VPVTVIVKVPVVAVEVVVIVSVDVFDPPDVGVTFVGLRERVTPVAGAVPTQDLSSETGEEKGLVDFTVIVLEAESP
jgi:hypothetical protein